MRNEGTKPQPMFFETRSPKIVEVSNEFYFLPLILVKCIEGKKCIVLKSKLIQSVASGT